MSNLVLCPSRPLQISHLARRHRHGSPNGRVLGCAPAFPRRKCLPIFEQPPSIGCTFTSTEAMPLRRKVVDKQVDWSKAPEGATHWDPEDRNWLRQFDGISLIWLNSIGWSDPDSQYPKDLSSLVRLVARPASAAWSGEGLPPVGTICEWRDDDAGCWHKVEVRYLSKHTALLHFPGDGDGDGDTEGAFAPNYCQFRPLRTPDQIAAEERKKVIDKMVEDMAENMFELGCDYDRAVMLYEKGYRKDPHTADLLRALKDIATASEQSTVGGLKQLAAGTLAAVEGGAQ